ncbi:transposase family protein [Streptomyces bacillaris]|uniref:transposase family protein n=1 Tax=Streptomyces bacillaris TaxID=68179 RepID=UPI0034659C57
MRTAIISDRRITGLSAAVIAELVAEVGPLWHERHQAKLASRPRKRAVGAGAKHRLVFVDRLLATLVHLRHGVTHDVLACWFGVDRSTVTRAVGEVRPLLAERGCTISPDVRLRTLAEVIGHLGETGKTGIIDGTEIRVRRPAVGRKDRDKFISGKNKQNAVKAMVLTDEHGRLLFCSPTRPGSCADITHARALGLVKLLADGPAVEILADAGYRLRTVPFPSAARDSGRDADSARETGFRAACAYGQRKRTGRLSAGSGASVRQGRVGGSAGAAREPCGRCGEA